MIVKKRLVFYFFIPEDYETNVAIKFHIACLRMYANIFDSATFYISYNDNEKKYVNEVKDILYNLKEWNDITIRVAKNDLFCEARCFKEDIIDKIDLFNEEIVFFGHTKGVTNVLDYPDNMENILKWIFCCYFYSLEFPEEAIKETFFAHRIFYGSMLMDYPHSEGAYYAGAFYWLNPMKIKNSKINGTIPVLADRAYAESFPMLYRFKNGDGYLSSHYRKYLYFTDLYYANFDDLINFYGDYDAFMKRYNDILNSEV